MVGMDILSLQVLIDRTIDVVDLDAFVNYIKAKGEVNPQIEGRVTKLN